MLYVNKYNEVINTDEVLSEPWLLVPQSLEAQFRELYPFEKYTTQDGVVTSLEDDTEARKAYVPSEDPQPVLSPWDEMATAYKRGVQEA